MSKRGRRPEQEEGQQRGEKRARDFSHLVAGGSSSAKDKWGKADEEDGTAEAAEDEKANFGLSGALNKDTSTGNTYRGITLKWSEPSDARKPDKHWRLYVFKADELISTLHLHRQSAYMVGRQKAVADIHVEHLSISKQHAVFQFRLHEAPKPRR